MAPQGHPPSTFWTTSAPCLMPWLTSWMPCWTEQNLACNSPSCQPSLPVAQHGRSPCHARNRQRLVWAGVSFRGRGLLSEAERTGQNLTEGPQPCGSKAFPCTADCTAMAPEQGPSWEHSPLGGGGDRDLGMHLLAVSKVPVAWEFVWLPTELP